MGEASPTGRAAFWGRCLSNVAKPYLSLSVHQLVDFLLRTGDIDDRIYNQETMQMGTKLHGAQQEKQGNSYLSEYPLSGTISRPLGDLALSGRADGIIVGGICPIIDEIKTSVIPLEEFYKQQSEWHKGQALVYAYLYLQKNPCESAMIQLTYISQVKSGDTMVKRFHYKRKEIEEVVEGYCDDYLAFYQRQFTHWRERDESAKALEFPYPDFRDGQRELAKYCFGIAKKGGILFAEAPTGIGKTMSTLFPFVKSFDERRVQKIFYFTAKNTGAQSAFDAITDLKKKGLAVRDSNLLAKEKMCLCPGHRCNPDDCKFAKGYYTKLKTVIEAALDSGERFDQVAISYWCRTAEICPFEFQLDLSLFSDIVIGDYNYFFDPIVHLERYFDPSVDQSKFLVLIDEAHNLVERGRMMYSASLSTRALGFAKKALKGKEGYATSLRKAITKVEKAFKEYEIEGREELLEEAPSEIEKALESLKNAEQKVRKENSKALEKMKLLSEFSREGNRYLRLLKDFSDPSDRFAILKKGEEDYELNLFCLDPSKFLKQSLERVRGAVLFSATLTPSAYFTKSILGKEDSPFLLLPSPFPKENFKVMLASSVSVRYRDREASYPEVASYLKSLVCSKVGNYFIYFPSYEYLSKIRPYLDFPDASILVQSRRMKEEEKLDFLSSFLPSPKITTVGLLVLGGAFGEGIDLVSDRLIGVGIVGVGMPQVGFENNLLKDYFEQKEKRGFLYAYQNPGISKVLQALGRVIRSEKDVGAALLIDDRYGRGAYRDLLRRRYPQCEIVHDEKEVSLGLESFYSKKGE